LDAAEPMKSRPHFRSAVGACLVVFLALHAGAAKADTPDKEAPPPPPSTPSTPSSGVASGEADTAVPAPAKPDADSAAPPEKPGANKEADKAEPGKAPAPKVVFLQNQKPSPKRELPNYDGRGQAPSTAGQDLLWVPRIVFSPIYFTTEFIIRRPLEAGISAAERSHVPEVLYDFFFFGPDHKAGVVPTIFFDFGFSPSVGLFGFWDNAGFAGHDLTAHFSIWTSEWVAGSIGERFRFNAKDSFSLKFAALRRPDRTFFGIGPSSLQDNLSRYGETRIEESGTFDVPLWRNSQFQAGSGFRSVDLYDGSYGTDPGIVEEAARGTYALPYGFGRGYSDVFSHALLALDTRKANTRSGLRLEAQGESGSDVRNSPDSGWIRYQGTAGVFVDLNGRGRVLSLSATALFADPLVSGGQVPFTELVTLGGNTAVLSALATGAGLMPGFYSGRLVDRSAAVATLQYNWPIWSWLDGSLQVAAGNVFGDHLEEFRPGLLRMSGAIGIQSTGVSENALHLLLGIGSETFDHGGQVDTIRLAFGTSRF
jgi:hypothetical protein